ncbi:hypothetical protein ACVBEQ_21190 [Nakamurella sp. GG22]
MVHPVSSRRRPRHRWSIVLIVGVAALLMIISTGAGRDDHGSAAQAGASPVAVNPVPPGIQPPVQAWLKVREKKLIDLNNALVPVVQAPGLPAAAACARVLAAAKTMSGQAKAPNAQVDVLARAGLAKIEQGAAACVTGDAGGGKRLIAEGLAERTAATEPFDETLEGE